MCGCIVCMVVPWYFVYASIAIHCPHDLQIHWGEYEADYRSTVPQPTTKQLFARKRRRNPYIRCLMYSALCFSTPAHLFFHPDFFIACHSANSRGEIASCLLTQRLQLAKATHRASRCNLVVGVRGCVSSKAQYPELCVVLGVQQVFV